MSESKTSKRRLKAAETKSQVIDLRRAGHSYQEISTRVGVNRSRCFQIVKEYLAECNRLSSDSIEKLRQEELDRLDTLQASIWDKARAGDLKCIELVVKIAMFRSRLQGTESARKVDQTTTLRGPLSDLTDSELAQEAERLGLAVPPEILNPPPPDTIPFPPNRAG